MKKFFCIFTIFFFISSQISLNAFAEPGNKTLSQGIYDIRDSQILVNTALTAKLTNPNENIIILIINSNLTIKALVRLNVEIPQQVLPPLKYGDSAIVFGNGTVELL